MAARKKVAVEAQTAEVQTTEVKAVEEQQAEVATVETELETGDVVGAEDEVLDAAADTVCVCANVPHDIKFVVPDNRGRKQVITIRGNGSHLKGADRGVLPVGAYGITAGVPAEAWEYIVKAYADNRAIKNGLVFATTANKARAAAKERKSLRNGLEPIKPAQG